MADETTLRGIWEERIRRFSAGHEEKEQKLALFSHVEHVMRPVESR
jgi:hypothetical protein